MHKRRLLLTSILLIGIFLSFYSPTAKAVTENLTFYPTDDAYVDSSASSANYGSSVNLFCKDSGPTQYSYILFNLSSITGRSVVSAMLKFSTYGYQFGSIYKVTPVIAEWDESTITYDNAPGHNSTPESSGTIGFGVSTEVTLVVTSWVSNATPNYGFHIAADPGEWNIKPKEWGSGIPSLVIELVTIDSGFPSWLLIIIIVGVISVVIIGAIILFKTNRKEKGRWITKNGRRIFIKDKK